MKDKDCNDGDTDSGHCVEHVTDALNLTVTDKGKNQQKSMQAKYERLAKNANCVTTVKEKSILVSMPGPTRQDLTRVGNVGVWTVMQWCEDADAVAEHVLNPKTGRTLLGLNEIYANRLIFVASVKCTIDEDFYKLVDANERTPISGEFGLQNVGNSSMGIFLAIVDDSSGKELARLVKQTVLMDESSRKPVPIPYWWKKSHGSLVRENKKLVQAALDVPAENTYKYTLKVAWSDIDSYYHVNYRSYVIFCFDAAMEAVRHGFYIGFFDDILKYNVKTLSIRYINEALVGDILTVITWQDALNPRIINFSIERDGNALVQISMEFFLRANL